MEQWKIHKGRLACEKPGCTLAAETDMYAILQLPDCVRIERCRSCLEEQKLATGEMPFHWVIRRNFDGKVKAVLDLESLRVLFDRLGSEETTAPQHAPRNEPAKEPAKESASEPAETAAETTREAPPVPKPDTEEDRDPVRDRETVAGLRYLVALLLLRKRRLKMVDPQNAEQEAADLVVVDPKVEGMEPVALFAPELDPERLGSLREELMVALGEESETESANVNENTEA